MTLLLEIAFKGLCVLTAGTVLAAALRNSSAAMRHLAWSLTTIVVLVLPALVAMTPRTDVAVDVGDSLVAWLPAVEPMAVSAAAGTAASEASEASAQAEPLAAVDVTATTATPPAPMGPPAAAPVEREDQAGTRESAAGGGAPVSVVALLAAVWLAGMTGLLGLLALERIRLTALSRGATPCANGALRTAFERLCPEAGLRRTPTLLLGPSRLMPMTWGTIRAVVILPAEAREWPASRIEAVLAHEIAHIRRLDDLTQITATIAAACHWFNPLAWLALHRLRVERELACDDEVLQRGGRPSKYARELIEIASRFRRSPWPQLSAQTMAGRSQLRLRVAAVLEESRRRHRVTTRRVMAGLVTAGALALPLASVGIAVGPPAETTPVAESDPATGQATASPTSCWSTDARISQSTTDDDSYNHQWTSASCQAELTLRGELRFGDDFNEISGISAGGSFRLEIDEDGTTRRLDLMPGPSGQLVVEWRVNGRVQPYDEAAAAWVRAILPPMFRATGLAAPERAAFIYRQQGADGLVREIGLIRSNSVRGRYLIAMFGQDGLRDADMIRGLEATREIDSNSTTTRVLEAFDSRHGDRLLEGGVAAAFWETASGIDSNSNMSRLLSAIIDGEPAGSPLIARVLQEAAARIGSSSTLASFLRRVQQRYPAIATGGPHAEQFWTVAAGIDSNSTARSFLLDLSDGEPVDSALLPIIFEMAGRALSSNSTMAEFLTAIDRRYPGLTESGPMTDEFWRLAREVSSSSTLSAMLLSLAEGKPDASAVLDRVLAFGSAEIGSSSQLGEFLVTFARQHQEAAGGRLESAMLAVAGRIGSRSTRERTLERLAALGVG